MQISISEKQGNHPVTVMHLEGNLDASSYTDVINKARESYDGGARNLLIDMSKVPYLSSAGLMSLHTTVLIFSGQTMKSEGSIRPTFRSIDPARDTEARKRVKLLNPQPAIEQVLDVVGLKDFFTIFSDLESAIQSF